MSDLSHQDVEALLRLLKAGALDEQTVANALRKRKFDDPKERGWFFV
jgi:hypothetical protein